MIFVATNQIQSSITDVAFNPTPRTVMKTALDMAQVFAEAPVRLMPQESTRLAWLEFQNKLEAFTLFEHVDLVLNLQTGDQLTPARLIAQASAFDPYRSVWITEGIGHYCAQGGRDAAWPTERLAALHAGMGLSFAAEVLETVPANMSSAELRKKLEEFLSLCRNHSHEGYVGATYEALGLVARNLYPHLLRSIDAELMKLDPQLVGYFWHGVGRAIYFTPSNLFVTNSAPWRAVEMALNEPPHDLGRLNALAGLIWSLALVNLRQPQILDLFLQYHGLQVTETDVFEKSLFAALLIWRDSSGSETLIDKLARYQPSTPTLCDLWLSVRQACANASESHYLALKETNSLGSLFRCY